MERRVPETESLPCRTLEVGLSARLGRTIGAEEG